jgi:hypothetical protein
VEPGCRLDLLGTPQSGICRATEDVGLGTRPYFAVRKSAPRLAVIATCCFLLGLFFYVNGYPALGCGFVGAGVGAVVMFIAA